MPLDLNGLRRWLVSLDDVGLGEVLGLPTELPYLAGISVATQSRARWRARELRSARAYLRRATSQELRAVAEQATSFATHQLVYHFGFSPESLKEPTGESLQGMLSALPPVQARLLCYFLFHEEPHLLGELGCGEEELLGCVSEVDQALQ